MKDVTLPPLGRQEDCVCGRRHVINTRAIEVGDGVIAHIPRWMDEYGLSGRALIISDKNTYAAAGQTLEKVLRDAGRTVSTLVIGREHVHADEMTLGEIMMNMEPRPQVLIAVGTGSLNDSTRYIARQVNLPYFVLATAASMDGFASTVTPVTRDGLKLTYGGVHPQMVLAEASVLADAPLELAAAGFGDVLGKRTALTDWMLARDVTGEDYCPVIAGMMEQAMDVCLQVAEGLGRRDKQSVIALMKALALSGIAMQMNGNSRPASGMEHHMSHFWEMRDLSRGKPASLHGDKVGVATLIGLRIYEKFFTVTPPVQGRMDQGEVWERAMTRVFGDHLAPRMIEAARPSLYSAQTWSAYQKRILANWDSYARLVKDFPRLRQLGRKSLAAAHGPVEPGELGYSRQDVYDAIRYARFVRPERPTLLTWADHWGVLEQIAGEIVDEL